MSLETLLAEVRSCSLCTDLPLGPNPLVQAGEGARILIAGQAPGRITHHKDRPFDDPSGNRLREWLGITRETFYDPDQVAVLAMGFCYPGTGKGGDLPPRPLCAATWRGRLLSSLPHLKLTLVIGQYAQAWHLPHLARLSLTERVRGQDAAASPVIALPHPSPRNGIWLKANPWFGEMLLPTLRQRVKAALDNG
ncbi:MAG: uracil-DNA glycosylase family protein [Rhizobiales bacterium]|nr:uracil-DNA glycosylase family protein [Hyphomicrobiales bacterium]